MNDVGLNHLMSCLFVVAANCLSIYISYKLASYLRDKFVYFFLVVLYIKCRLNCLLEIVQQEKFYNAPTQNMTRTAVVKEIVKFAAEGIGNSYSSALESGFSDRSTDLLTRVSFKVTQKFFSFNTSFF